MIHARISTACHAVVLCLALSACGSGGLFTNHEERQAEIRDLIEVAFAERGDIERQRAEAQALNRERNAERAEQRVTAVLDLMDQSLARIDTRLANLEGRPAADQTSASQPSDSARDLAGIRMEINQLRTALNDMVSGGRQGDAQLAARLERLEHRTSELRWPDAPGGVSALHLASYRRHEDALAGWEILRARHPLLEVESPTMVEVRTVSGIYVRLFTGVGLDRAELLSLRTSVRDGGDYAMIMFLPSGPSS